MKELPIVEVRFPYEAVILRHEGSDATINKMLVPPTLCGVRNSMAEAGV